MRFCFNLFLLALVLVEKLLANPCDIVPFPPFPPSPPEFQEPLKFASLSDALLVEWSPLVDTDGYLVAVCRPQEGRYRFLAQTTANNLLVNSFTEADTYYFQVRAFADIENTMVMNTGMIGFFAVSAAMVSALEELKPEVSESEVLEPEVSVAEVSESGTTESPSPESPSPKTKSAENMAQALQVDASSTGQAVSYVASRRIAEAHPALNGLNSVYNPYYPHIENPFFETVQADGTVVAPLIDDEAIDKTIARLQQKREEQGLVTVDFTALSAAEVKPTEARLAEAKPIEARQAEARQAEVSPKPQVATQSLALAIPEKPLVMASPTSVAEPKQTSPVVEPPVAAKPVAAPPIAEIPADNTEPSSGFGLILTIAIILGIVYFIVAKETK